MPRSINPPRIGHVTHVQFDELTQATAIAKNLIRNLGKPFSNLTIDWQKLIFH